MVFSRLKVVSGEMQSIWLNSNDFETPVGKNCNNFVAPGASYCLKFSTSLLVFSYSSGLNITFWASR